MAILITYFAPWVMAPILILGGSYLAFEGTESLAEKIGVIKEHNHSHGHSMPNTDDLMAAEDETVNSAVRTDTILSIEIIALTIASVATEAILTQLGVLIIVALVATFAVYGIVGVIIKMDDIGFYLKEKKDSGLYQNTGALLIQGMPKVLKALGWIGMIAMLMVGGGIVMHNIPQLHMLTDITHNLSSTVQIITDFFIIPVVISITLGVFLVSIKALLTRIQVTHKNNT